MSVFDLSTDDSDALEEHAQLNIAQQNEPEGDFTKGFAASAGNSFVNAGFVQLGKRAMMAGAVAPILYDAASGAITGKENTDSQDWYFKNVVDDLGQDASKYWTPDASHTNMAGEIVGGVAGGLLNFAAAGFNPAVVGLGAYTDVTADMTHAGVGDKAANAIGVVNAVAAGAGVKLPAAFGSTLMQRLATGAAGNTVFGMAQRGVTSEILEADGKEEMAAGYDWLDVKSVAADALMGAAFGGQHHYFGKHAALDIPESQRKPLQDAVLTLNAEEHANTTTAPGEPATPAAAAAHHAELRNAMDSVMRGEPVNVSHKIHDVEFTPHKVEPVRITEMRGDLTDLLHEDGLNQFAQQLLDHQGVEGAYKTHEEARFVVDQFGAGIQKLHGAGVSMDRLSQMRSSFGKPSEEGAVFNQNGKPEDASPDSAEPVNEYKGDPTTELWSILGSREKAYKYNKPSNSKELGDHFENVNLNLKTSHDPAMSKAENANATLIETTEGKHGYVLERDGKVWMDVSTLDQGDSGSAFYRAVADYAKNTGKKFVEDPAGLSNVAMHRRLENMISSAILHGTTGHLGIGEKQARGGAGVAPLRWIEGDHKFNMRGMVNASYESVVRHFPELENVDYNITTGKFEDISDGSEWTDGRFSSLAAEGRSREAVGKSLAARREDPVTEGLSTLKRAVLTASISRQSSEGQSVLLDRVRAGLAESLPSSLENILYQKGGDAFVRNVNGTTEAPQGQINFGIDGEKLNAVISLFGTANKSTALHELSHNFLEIYKHLNQFDDTPASIKADYAEMRRLIGADDVGSPLTKDHHERFAESFEQYTREGKAPTPALKRAFEHFKEWMTAIYQRAADLGAPINDDMRAMFDTMLGKEMEVSHFDPLLKNPDVQNELRRMAKNAGWAEVGGKVIMDEDRNAVGRTQWIPKEEWYTAGMGKPEDLERIVGKAIRGEKLSKKQQATVESMLESPAHDRAREDAQLDSVLGNEVKQTAEEQDAFWDSMMGDLPETGAIAGIMNEWPDMHIMQEDGAMVSAKDATTKLQEGMAESEKMPSVYDAAINCFLRNGQ